MIACFVLLAEAMVGVARDRRARLARELVAVARLIVMAYAVVGFAARREWHDERFRRLYLATTRERPSR